MKALLVPALDADSPVKLLLQVVEPSPQPEAAPPSKVGPTLERDAATLDADGDVEMAAAERLASGQAASTSGRAAVPGSGQISSLWIATVPSSRPLPDPVSRTRFLRISAVTGIG